MANLHLLLDTKHRLLEVDGEVEAQVIALTGTTPPRTRSSTRPPKATEEGLKQVGKAAHVAHIRRAAAA